MLQKYCVFSNTTAINTKPHQSRQTRVPHVLQKILYVFPFITVSLHLV